MPLAGDRLLNDYFAVCRSLKIDSFLLYGTCLGFVREGGYIKGDNDIDVGILNGIWELAAALCNAGFIHIVTVRDNSHFIKYGVLLDVWFDFPDKKYFRAFDKILYKGASYSVPHPVKDFLAFSYGDWQTPSKTQPYKGEEKP